MEDTDTPKLTWHFFRNGTLYLNIARPGDAISIEITLDTIQIHACACLIVKDHRGNLVKLEREFARGEIS
jgi:hypothetical protein